MKSGLDAKPLFLQVDMLNPKGVNYFSDYILTTKKHFFW